ncbi:hypothetical protein [Armatimonas rosea]|uniref:Uncharacterized protein n=1 Tax=Armatimonas rosea TaxID=685828 RepID=A0A7W9SNB1_ARMRO|nr:hypothetical protein [Armatimonas rosea]MBB6049761.1 hypothetical protein [Armatimonas rosea]
MDFAALYQTIFRTDTTAPGYALVPVPEDRSLSNALAWVREGLEAVQGKPFGVVHQTEFDQQVTTRFHRDGGPDESFLFLGYAPTGVHSVVRIADHVRAAAAHHLTPEAFLSTFPPLSPRFSEVLAPFVTALTDFDHTRPQLLLLNNSVATGVLHQATIPSPDPALSRKILSWMLTP